MPEQTCQQTLPNARFSKHHWFNRRARLLFTANELRNQAWARSSPIAPVFDSSAVFFSKEARGRCIRKGTTDDGKGVFLGNDADLQFVTGTYVFQFQLDSVALYTNLYCNAKAGGAVGFLVRVNNAGKVELVKINTAIVYTGNTVLKTGQVYTIAVNYTDNTTTVNLAINGQLDTATSASARTSYTFDEVRLCSSGVASFDTANRMWLAAISPVSYSAELLKELSADPYQLLEPDPVYMRPPAVVAGGGIVGPLVGFRHLGGGGALIGGRLVLDRHERNAA